MLKIDVVLCSSGGIILVAADGAFAAARMHGVPDLQDGDCTLTSQGTASCMEKARNTLFGCTGLFLADLLVATVPV